MTHRVYYKKLDVKLVASVHDEYQFEVANKDVGEFCSITKIAIKETEDLLKNTIILFDPSLNPDGLQRFAYWANTNKSKNINPDPNDREYYEVWPRGRTNHYWFDMNRDWLPVQLPESRARIESFHKWLPNILTDHHEMGSNSTFFFQPGIPSRTHPLTPQLNQDLTKEIANYHARAFDKIGSQYYSEERKKRF